MAMWESCTYPCPFVSPLTTNGLAITMDIVSDVMSQRMLLEFPFSYLKNEKIHKKLACENESVGHHIYPLWLNPNIYCINIDSGNGIFVA